MILSPKYAQRLVSTGKATLTATVKDEVTGRTLQALDRHDVGRVDHYFLPVSR